MPKGSRLLFPLIPLRQRRLLLTKQPAQPLPEAAALMSPNPPLNRKALPEPLHHPKAPLPPGQAPPLRPLPAPLIQPPALRRLRKAPAALPRLPKMS